MSAFLNDLLNEKSMEVHEETFTSSLVGDVAVDFGPLGFVVLGLIATFVII